jgi:hypothetical protein
MKIAEVKKIELKSEYPGLTDISAILDEQEKKLTINKINWEEYSYKPEVAISMAYSDREIFLKYYVTENSFKAEKTETNAKVYEDSCVEFFVSPEDDGIYYNLEFNAIGTCLMGSGTGRANNIHVNPETISKIRILTSAGKTPVKISNGEFKWTIIIGIPFGVFFHHKIITLKGKTFRANFYKCGDKLTVPHYVTWNPVGTEKPDYHQPAYFGKLLFI